MENLLFSSTTPWKTNLRDNNVSKFFILTIMSAVVTAVFKATVGLLVNKGRDKAAEKLRDGDVLDQKLRRLIVREIDDIKSKLDGLSRKDLLASISFFKEGIELLYDVFDKARSGSENGAGTSQAACAEKFSLAKALRKLDLTGRDESDRMTLSDAKERFKDARKEATRAFNNEALETSDRILAMQYRVMATILEKVDNPADAVSPCRVCIEELHCLPAVQECFNVELGKGLRARLGKEERRKIICDVCHVNFVIHGVTMMVCFGNKEPPNLPCIGSRKVDPLRHERVTKVLRKKGLQHCCVTPWPLSQERKEKHKLKAPEGIATNSSGQFIVGDYGDSNVKVFASTGEFLDLVSLHNDDVKTKVFVLDVATDMNDNIYLLARLSKSGAESYESVVYEFNKTGDLNRRFRVMGDFDWGRLTITDSDRVLVLCSPKVIAVYETDGQFVYSFGEKTLKDSCDITVANDGHVMVLDWRDACVHIFRGNGDHLKKFKLQGCYSYPRIAFHRASEHVVVAGVEQEKDLLHVEIFTKHGEFVRNTQIHEEGIHYLQGMTVTTEGRIAVVCGYRKKTLPLKVLVW